MHEDKTYKCSICGSIFSTKDNLRNHTKMIHGEKSMKRVYLHFLRYFETLR